MMKPKASRVAVLASNSFSGGCLVKRLLKDEQCRVLGINRSPEKSALFLPYRLNGVERFQFHQLDLNTQTPRVFEALDAFQPEIVVNFAAQGEVGTSWRHPEQWFETNAVAVAKLGNFLKDRPYLQRYMQISTPEVYGSCEGTVREEDARFNPSTPYAASKAAGDLFLLTLRKQYGFPLITIRSTNVYGRHQQLYRIIPRTIIYLRQGRKIRLDGGGQAVKAYIHIRDVCEGILAAMERGRDGEVYHLSPDSDISIRDLVRLVCELMGRDFNDSIERGPERPGQDARYVINSSKARREFGWAPRIGLREGIQEMIDWIDSGWEEILKEPLDYVYQP